MSKKFHEEIESWIRVNISIEALGKHLLAGLEADKISNKEVVPDFTARLAYIDWICINGRYIAEKKVAGGTFQMAAPSADSIAKVFGEQKPQEE